MKKGLKKGLLIALIVFLVVTVVSIVGIGIYFVNYALRPMAEVDPKMLPQAGEDEASQNRVAIIKGNRRIFNNTIKEWYPKQDIKPMEVETEDGLTLRGRVIFAPEESHKYIISVHGYQGRGDWMVPFAYVFQMWGYNTLLPDLRAHGNSDGKWIGMGGYDHEDLLLWIDAITEMDPEAEIVLHGISMGGATVMLAASDEKLPDNVVAVIEDCGYSSAPDVFADTIRRMYHMPGGFIMFCANLMGRPMAGYWLNGINPAKELVNADPDLPMLFIHGELDNFVPYWMLDVNYGAKRGIKEKLSVPDTDHGNSYVREPELYFNTVKDFLDKYVD